VVKAIIAVQSSVYSPRAVTRILRLLEALAKAPEGCTLAELNVALSAPKSSLLVLLRPLVAEEYLLHTGGRYFLASNMFSLASEILSTRQFHRLIRPHVEALARRTHESVFLGMLDRESRMMTFIDKVDSPYSVRFTLPVGSARPLYATAGGRLLLAYQDKAWQDDYIQQVQLTPLTPSTVDNRGDLQRELDSIRKTGLSMSIEESSEGGSAIAAPVFDVDGSVVAALVVAAPTSRLKRQLPLIQQALLEVANAASITRREKTSD